MDMQIRIPMERADDIADALRLGATRFDPFTREQLFKLADEIRQEARRQEAGLVTQFS